MQKNIYYYHLTHGEGDQFDYKYADWVIFPELALKIVNWAESQMPAGYYNMIGSGYFDASSELALKLSKNTELAPNFINKIIPEIKTYSLVGYRPHSIATRHRDATIDIGRNTVLQVPLTPSEKDYAPIDFWESMDQEVPVNIARSQGTGKAFLFDSQQYHSVHNNNNVRWNLQVSFEEPLAVIVDMIEKKKFFKQIWTTTTVNDTGFT
jgi:hypothetical protein